jgi:hypothetical protein
MPDCAHCGKHTLEPEHHMKLKSRGGSDDPQNLVQLCGRFEDDCHGKVHRYEGDWTKRFRTHSWQEESMTEADAERGNDQ